MHVISKNYTLTHKSESRDFYGGRAILNFLVANFSEALSDADKALALDANSPEGLTVKGYSLEGLKRYKEAADAYYRIAAISGQNNYLVWAAIANRKATGQ